MSELKPCPWCGADARVVKYPGRNEEPDFRVECTAPGCHAYRPNSVGDLDDAIAAWNERASHDDYLREKKYRHSLLFGDWPSGPKEEP